MMGLNEVIDGLVYIDTAYTLHHNDNVWIQDAIAYLKTLKTMYDTIHEMTHGSDARIREEAC